MSAMGQKQTLADVRAMSALPPKADINARPHDVRLSLKKQTFVRSLGRFLHDDVECLDQGESEREKVDE
jgi:hypothetical protein